MRLRGKVALVTGAARGIGRAIARRYAEEGASVVIADLDEAGAIAAAEGIGSQALGVRLDVTQQDSIAAAIAATVARFGRLDILVNNAGIFDLAPILDITRASYARVFAVNVEGLLFTLQAAARQMVAQNEAAQNDAARGLATPRPASGGGSIAGQGGASFGDGGQRGGGLGSGDQGGGDQGDGDQGDGGQGDRDQDGGGQGAGSVGGGGLGGGRRGGRIINFASQAGRRGEALVGVYCASKAAVISLTQSAGLDLIRHGINVNAIAPGVVDAEHWDDVDARFARAEGLPVGEKKRQVGRAVPIGRMAQPEEIAGLAVFLASDDAGYIVAQTYGIDGGNWMS